MKRLHTLALICASLFLASVRDAPRAAQAELSLPQEGWASWDVPAITDAPAWCCLGPNAAANTSTCRLDEASSGYTRRDDQTTQMIRVYARFDEGRVQRVRALAADCPVQSSSPIAHLGAVSDAMSARWLSGVVTDSSDSAIIGRRLRGDAMAALATHRTPLAQNTLADIARNDSRPAYRKDAVFWLAQLRGRPGADVAAQVMFNDANPKVRKHAAFALSQSASPQAAADLIKLGNGDRDADVRGQAWFWLAQTAAAEAEQAIAAALRTEASGPAGEQAVFALSQLPDERATKALIAVAQNRDLPREYRKRAVFWLAQNGSDEALAYLDRIVANPSAR